MKPFVSHQKKTIDTKTNIPYNIKISNKIDATDQKRGQIEVKPGYHLIGKSDCTSKISPLNGSLIHLSTRVVPPL